MIKRDVTYIELNKYCWTEDNRMQGMSDKNNGAWYNYDATGERNLKLTGQTYYVNQNGQDYYAPIFDQQTLYANPLITINDKGYTKHYFEEGKRICSKIGSGGLIDIGGNMEGINQGIEEIRDLQREGVEKTFDICMQIYPYINTNNLHETVVKPYEGPINPDEPIFYYHSDHLGSASFLTDTNGIETQQLVYLPFGEDWVDMKYNTSQYDTPYKFNGKEKDEETGYNNYGARYYYDWASIWLSVDPMSDKYPSLTSYNYCANNPVMLIDPDGREIRLAKGLSGKQIQVIVGNLQKLTNDKLVYKTLPDGSTQIKIISLGTENTDNKLNYGTNIIRELNKKGPDEKIVNIEVTSGGNYVSGKTTNANIKSDGSNDNGEGSTVYFNPDSIFGGLNQEGSNERPSYIGLGHELIHAKNRYEGKRDPNSSGKIDPDGSGTILSKEEVNTRLGENKLRKEQNLPLREIP